MLILGKKSYFLGLTIFKIPQLNWHYYRVSHNDMALSWLWGVEWSRILMIYLWQHGQEGYPFVFHQPIFKQVALGGLNSLRQKVYQILVKKGIFDDPFHKKGLLLVMFVTGMIQRSRSVIFLMKWGCLGHWGHQGCWDCWGTGHWGCRGSKA